MVDEYRTQIRAAYLADETQCITELVGQAKLNSSELSRIWQLAYELVSSVRKDRSGKASIDAFLFEYDLSSDEGISLMCLAEAMLRIPDKKTIDNLIKDKLTSKNWHSHKGNSGSYLVNLVTRGLILTNKVIGKKLTTTDNSVIGSLIKRSGEPLVRKAVLQAMRILGKQFVLGESIESAIKRAKQRNEKFLYSFDMLGEAALTAEEAKIYYAKYLYAIETLGKRAGNDVHKNPGISVKLSALHPRFEFAKSKRVMQELLPKVTSLALAAKKYNIGFTIDAEESHRTEPSLDIIGALIQNSELDGWQGLGFAVQAYQKRCIKIIDWAVNIARAHNKAICIRLVKGAYWDSEIKWAQLHGLVSYPVFTRKVATDVAYIAAIRKLLAAKDVIYPQFATHNAYTAAVVVELAKGHDCYEFQCLHGMGDALYNKLINTAPCRIYAPVGSFDDLLSYLVRRLLENGANSSFVNRIIDDKIPIDDLLVNPIEKINELTSIPHPQIPLPENLYGQQRPNSRGENIYDSNQVYLLLEKIKGFANTQYVAKSSIYSDGNYLPVLNPADNTKTIGRYTKATKDQLQAMINNALAAEDSWRNSDLEERCKLLEKMANLLEKNKPEILYLLCHEGGKTLVDAINELREAIDFCWYYASNCRSMSHHLVLPGPTGEENNLFLEGRGIFVCISPWNFPLAIFLGQIAAALVVGNVVIAKPAMQTTLIASYIVELLYSAGVDKKVLQLAIATGSDTSTYLLSNSNIKGVMFTGSNNTAKRINIQLAQRDGPFIPFIAETGGQNAMIVDSSALLEQLIPDVLMSAFGSVGQRCSALRVIYVQQDIYVKFEKMLQGAMQEIQIGDPLELSTDMGPVIDDSARSQLQQHIQWLDENAKLIQKSPIDKQLSDIGTYMEAYAYEIANIGQLTKEHFGPILHVIQYAQTDLDQVIDDINNTGYGLTFGVHSRIDENIKYICSKIKVGNVYVNRNIIGAVVGVQPFGGHGLSGTGPKAGGPNYLSRLVNEKTVSINTAAVGGNASLMMLHE